MVRRFLFPGMLVAAMFGCSKPNAPTAGGGPAPSKGSPETLADPNATYAIKFREPQQGDKSEVVRARDATATMKKSDGTQTQKEEFRYEHTETILEMSADDPRPARLTRVYKTARRTDPATGEVKKASHVGKTIEIEKFLKGYKITVEGASLPPAEQLEINEDFNRGQWKLTRTLPSKPVKIGEEWAVDFAAISALGGKAPADYDKNKSKITGKLARAWRQDGRLRGVIEIRIHMVIDTTAANGSPVKGEIDTDVEFDIVIDGASREGKMKLSLKGVMDNRDMVGREVHTTIEGIEEQSLTPVK